MVTKGFATFKSDVFNDVLVGVFFMYILTV